MTDHQCTNCLHRYTSDEYRDLETRMKDPEHPRYGKERVCAECGQATTGGDWARREDIEVTEGEITVFTTALSIPHGLDENQWFETRIEHPYGTRVAERYETADAAEAGHDRFIDLVRAEAYDWKPTGKQIVLEEDT